MQMRDISVQLKKLEVHMSEFFLVHFILNTLLQEYGLFKISYNTHKDKWSINELMTMCVQEEERFVMEMNESALLTTACGRTKQLSLKLIRMGMVKYHLKLILRRWQSGFFCKKKGHMKKNCPRFLKWLEEKGKSISLVCYESNMASVNNNT